jgi:DNA processing protein
MFSSESKKLLDLLKLPSRRALELIKPITQTSASDDELIERFARVCMSAMIEPGDSVAGHLVQEFGAIATLDIVASSASGQANWQTFATQSKLDGNQLKAAFERWTPRFDLASLRRSFEAMNQFSMRSITPNDAEWPVGLDYLGFHAPLVLYVQGKQLDLFNQSVALVGSRAISPYGRWVAKEFAEQLVQANFSVVSGGAFGVDAAAHQATLNCGGLTLAVMAGGLDRYYPSGNEPMLRAIAEHGAICSEMAPGVTPTKWRFLQRNRLIAAISQATVVVEAGYRSGSINTAKHAGEVGRPVAAVPGSIASASSAGCHRLIAEAKATLVTSAADVLKLLDKGAVAKLEIDPLTDEQLRVYDALGARGGDENAIAKRSGMSLAQVYVALAQLELAEFAVRQELKWVRSGRNLNV